MDSRTLALDKPSRTAIDEAQTNIATLQKNLIIDSNEPVAATQGQLWVDTSNPGAIVIKVFNGSEWDEANQ